MREAQTQHNHARACVRPALIGVTWPQAALKWHPDKNTDNLEEATEMFKEITEAHSTLSDPNERAWYDSHREQILRGGTGVDCDDDGVGIDLFRYFTASCYKGYGDDSEGFYAVYSKVFEQVDEMEEVEEGQGHDAAPALGGSKANWRDGPAKFYAYWENFSTTREFAWCDKYNPNEAPNRQIKRAIDKENQKVGLDMHACVRLCMRGHMHVLTRIPTRHGAPAGAPTTKTCGGWRHG